MFGPSGEVLQPSEVLRKRPILVERGSFRPVTKVNIDMISSARASFAAEPEVEDGQIVELMEITMRNLLAGGKHRPGRFSGSRRRAGRRRKNRADLRLFRVLSAGGVPDPLYDGADRRHNGRLESVGPIQGAILYGARRRDPGGLRQAVHQRPEDLRLSDAR